MTTLTAREREVLAAMYRSEYDSDSCTPDIWLESLVRHATVKGKAFAGVVSSLHRKGILTSAGSNINAFSANAATVQVTKAGYAVAKALGLTDREPWTEEVAS
jgi:hypothetical protein